MNENDIAQLRELFAEQDRKFTVALAKNEQKADARFAKIDAHLEKVDKRIDAQTSSFAVALKQSKDDIVHEIREETRAMLAAAENRIVTAIGEILDASVLPQITELQREITVIKQHLQLA